MDSIKYIGHVTGYEETGSCAWCGGEFPDRRHRTYCSPECAQAYLGLFHWPEASKQALVRAHYKCERCGMSCQGLKYCTWSNRRLWHYPYNRWNLEVHHIDPIGSNYYADRLWSLKNVPWNLLVLCKECHGIAHGAKPAQEDIDLWELARRQGQMLLPMNI